jgi:hypothetical protein
MEEIKKLWDEFKALFNRDVASPAEAAFKDVLEALKNRVDEIDQVLALNAHVMPYKLEGSTVACPPVVELPVDEPAEAYKSTDAAI